MTQSDIQIEVISEMTGDPIELVREVVLAFKITAPKEIANMMDSTVSEKEAAVLRKRFRSSDCLISWYKEGLLYRKSVGN